MTVLHAIPKSKRHLLAAYRSQLAALIELERALVADGVIKPEERRVISRAERRQIDRNRTNVIE